MGKRDRLRILRDDLGGNTGGNLYGNLGGMRAPGRHKGHKATFPGLLRVDKRAKLRYNKPRCIFTSLAGPAAEPAPFFVRSFPWLYP